MQELVQLTWVFSRSFSMPCASFSMLDGPSGTWKASAKNWSKLNKLLHSEVNLLIQHTLPLHVVSDYYLCNLLQGFTVFAGFLNVGDGNQKKLKEESSGRLHVLQLDVTSENQILAALDYVQENLPQETDGEICCCFVIFNPLVANADLVNFLGSDIKYHWPTSLFMWKMLCPLKQNTQLWNTTFK